MRSAAVQQVHSLIKKEKKKEEEEWELDVFTDICVLLRLRSRGGDADLPGASGASRPLASLSLLPAAAAAAGL